MIDYRSIVLFTVCSPYYTCNRSDMEFAMHCACAEHNALCILRFASDGSFRFNESLTMAKLVYKIMHRLQSLY